MIQWESKPIKSLGRVVTGKTPPKDNSEYFVNGEELFVSPKDLDWNQFYVTKTETVVTKKALEKFKNQVLPKNAVMFTSLSFAFGKMGITSQKCLTNQQINSIIVNDKHDYKFVYYLLQTYRPIIFSYNSGIDTPIVPKSVFEGIEVKCPPLGIQQKIAAILSSYDDLIENNQRRIALLEKMAEEIYREWFVRFRFPGYQSAEFEKGIPKGWEKTQINKKLDFKSGFAFKSEKYVVDGKYGVVTIKNVHEGKFINECTDFIDELPDRLPKHCYIKDGDILMSLTGNVGRVCMAQGENLLLNQRVVILKAKNPNHSNFIYWSFRQKSMLTFCEMISTGAAQQNLSPIKLGDQEIIYPSDNLLLEFQEKINPITQMTLSLTKQIAQLEKTRNLLLPRLISGKLSVENLDIQFPPSMCEECTA